MQSASDNEFELQRLEHLLRTIPAAPRKEDTFFSIGGRGYYENPTSDILAYLMRPDAQHGFGALFITAFFDCMGVDHSKFSFVGVEVSREDSCDGGRIDLLVRGDKWALVIENKIRHWHANDLGAYEKYVERYFPGRAAFFATLSPEGEQASDWKPVTYRAYLAALRRTLCGKVFDNGLSKWSVFAHEFIIHLETELYNMNIDLTKPQIDFVEENIHAVRQIHDLSDAYLARLSSDLLATLAKVAPGHRIVASNKPGSITLEGPHIASMDFRTPLHASPPKNFSTGMWLRRLTPEQQDQVGKELIGMSFERSREEGGTWDGQFDTLEKALTAFRRMAEVLARVPVHTEPLASEAQQVAP